LKGEGQGGEEENLKRRNEKELIVITRRLHFSYTISVSCHHN